MRHRISSPITRYRSRRRSYPERLLELEYKPLDPVLKVGRVGQGALPSARSSDEGLVSGFHQIQQGLSACTTGRI